MKVSELRQAMKHLTSSATDKVKPNSKPDVKSSEQDSKPARLKFIVNPVTREYENTDYVENKFENKVLKTVNEDLDEAKRNAFMEFYGYGDRIAQKSEQLQKDKKLLDYIDKVKANDTKTLRMINEYQPKTPEVTKKISAQIIPQIDLPSMNIDFEALQTDTDRKKYEQSIVNPASKEGIAGLLNINNRKIK